MWITHRRSQSIYVPNRSISQKWLTTTYYRHRQCQPTSPVNWKLNHVSVINLQNIFSEDDKFRKLANLHADTTNAVNNAVLTDPSTRRTELSWVEPNRDASKTCVTDKMRKLHTNCRARYACCLRGSIIIVAVVVGFIMDNDEQYRPFVLAVGAWWWLQTIN